MEDRTKIWNEAYKKARISGKELMEAVRIAAKARDDFLIVWAGIFISIIVVAIVVLIVVGITNMLPDFSVESEISKCLECHGMNGTYTICYVCYPSYEGPDGDYWSVTPSESCEEKIMEEIKNG